MIPTIHEEDNEGGEYDEYVDEDEDAELGDGEEWVEEEEGGDEENYLMISNKPIGPNKASDGSNAESRQLPPTILPDSPDSPDSFVTIVSQESPPLSPTILPDSLGSFIMIGSEESPVSPTSPGSIDLPDDSDDPVIV
jgi:hypothetical protein